MRARRGKLRAGLTSCGTSIPTSAQPPYAPQDARRRQLSPRPIPFLPPATDRRAAEYISQSSWRGDLASRDQPLPGHPRWTPMTVSPARRQNGAVRPGVTHEVASGGSTAAGPRCITPFALRLYGRRPGRSPRLRAASDGLPHSTEGARRGAVVKPFRGMRFNAAPWELHGTSSIPARLAAGRTGRDGTLPGDCTHQATRVAPGRHGAPSPARREGSDHFTRHRRPVDLPEPRTQLQTPISRRYHSPTKARSRWRNAPLRGTPNRCGSDPHER